MPRSPTGFRFAVEAGKIRELADSIGDPRALLRSKAAARAAGHPAIPAPIVFTRSSYFQDTTHSSIYGQLGVEASEMRHAGQEWHLSEPLYAGCIYRVGAWRIVGEERKASRRGGEMRFVSAEREYRRRGATVLRECMTSVVVSAAGPASEPPPSAVSGDAEAQPYTREIRTQTRDWRHASPGTLLVEARIGPLGLTDFVRFAGAIGDFTPIHHDRAHARRFGLHDIIAMGMLPAAHALSLIEDGYGNADIASVRLRFHEPLYAGRSIAVRVEASGPDSATLDIRDDLSSPIISGSVQSRLA